MTGAGSPVLKRVIANDLCSGCGLCAGVSDGAVTMELQTKGFVRPVQSRPIDDRIEHVIETACPGSAVAEWDRSVSNMHPYWGPWFESLTGFATDGQMRHTGASGGALSALAAYALATGMVDRVLHVEADPRNPTSNRMRWSRSREEVISGAGSRYASSSPLACIDDAINEGGRFAFIGKPCDISALRRYALIDDRVDRHVPLMLSFFCGGMPGLRGVERIIDAMGLDHSQIADFRYRGNGWPGLTVAETHDGETRSMSYHESWGGHLSREVQFRCKICPDAVGAVADIACADAWYGDESGYPAFEEADGRSLILSRTSLGSELLRSAVAEGVIETKPLAIEEINLMQPSQASRKRAIAARVAACRVLLRPVPKMRGVEVADAGRKGSMRDNLHNFFGMLRRLLKADGRPRVRIRTRS
jgi:coenzyme F420 hydrogenase subunit beta